MSLWQSDFWGNSSKVMSGVMVNPGKNNKCDNDLISLMPNGHHKLLF